MKYINDTVLMCAWEFPFICLERTALQWLSCLSTELYVKPTHAGAKYIELWGLILLYANGLLNLLCVGFLSHKKNKIGWTLYFMALQWAVKVVILLLLKMWCQCKGLKIMLYYCMKERKEISADTFHSAPNFLWPLLCAVPSLLSPFHCTDVFSSGWEVYVYYCYLTHIIKDCNVSSFAFISGHLYLP